MSETPAIYEALLRAKLKFAPVRKDGQNPHLRNHYATLGSVLEAVEPALNAEGIVIVQTPVPTGDGWALQTRLVHHTGQSVDGLVPLIFALEGEKINPMQSQGSALSYARRYGLMGLLSLTAEDDDGHGAGFPPQARQQQPQRRDDRPQRPRDEAIDPSRPPRTGKALFAVISKQEEAGRKGLVKRVERWMADVGFDPKLRITELGERDVAEAWPVVLEFCGIDADLPVEAS